MNLVCPRCSGPLFKSYPDEDYSCLRCGGVMYAKKPDAGKAPIPVTELIRIAFKSMAKAGCRRGLICRTLGISQGQYYRLKKELTDGLKDAAMKHSKV